FSVGAVIDRIGAHPLAMQLPIGAASDFTGVVGVVRMKALGWRGEPKLGKDYDVEENPADPQAKAEEDRDRIVETVREADEELHRRKGLVWRGQTKLGEDYEVEESPADLQAKAEEYREKLVEKVAEADEELLEKYLGGEELTEEEIKAGVRKLTIDSEVNPVFCGTAFKNKGVQPLLDAVIDYLPSPLDLPPTEGHVPGDESTVITRDPDASAPFAALAFKIAAHPFFGTLTYIRVYSGEITSGQQVLNSTKGRRERVGKLFQMHANKENPVDKASAGHIYAVIGLKDTTTGDTLCDPNDPIILESMTFPEPVIHVAIEP